MGTEETILQRIGEAFSGVKFGRGVTARTSQGMIGLLVLWGIVAWRWSDNLVADGGLLLVGLIASGVFIHWMRSTHQFASKNPAQAMLDGAEFIEYKKFEAQTKYGPITSNSALLSDPQKHAIPLVEGGDADNA